MRGSELQMVGREKLTQHFTEFVVVINNKNIGCHWSFS
jgi:hypothetical protein